MKTWIHIFTDYKSLKPRDLLLPALMETDEMTFETLKAFDGLQIFMDTQTIYINCWIHKNLELIIPDYGIVPGTKAGFYLDQTEEMRHARDNTLHCSYCGNQFKGLICWCPECLGNSDIPETELYKTFLRPVGTLDIEINRKSIFIPSAIRERHNVMPELTHTGKLLNI